MFRLTSDITIGKYHFNGVNEVHIKKSIHSLTEYALIKLPSIAKTQKGTLNADGSISVQGGSERAGNTRDFFTDGDPVLLRLGYNGELATEFVGFVKQRSIGMPLEIECEGYVRQLRLNVNFSSNYTKSKTTIKALLNDMLKGTDIGLRCDVDCPIEGVKFTNANGIQVLDFLRQATDRTLCFYFIAPTTLYCGLPYTGTIKGQDVFGVGQAGYRLGWNLKRDNALKMKIPSEPVEIVMGGRYATQAAALTHSKDVYAKTKVKSMLNNIPENLSLQLFADEKKFLMNYSGLEGRLTGFLQPYCSPGYTVKLIDKLNPDVNGIYMAESTEVLFGIGGGRRHVELGPKIS